MSKKSFIIILILSIVITYGLSIIFDLIEGDLLYGEGGVPFSFTSAGGFLGESSINYINLLLDIVFWFLVILMIKKVINRLSSK
jgi:hypothetical protein